MTLAETVEIEVTFLRRTIIPADCTVEEYMLGIQEDPYTFIDHASNMTIAVNGQPRLNISFGDKEEEEGEKEDNDG